MTPWAPATGAVLAQLEELALGEEAVGCGGDNLVGRSRGTRRVLVVLYNYAVILYKQRDLFTAAHFYELQLLLLDNSGVW